ncbi:MAG TPA: hypothetical protein VGM15_03350 [Burkholderiaceae bacterium]
MPNRYIRDEIVTSDRYVACTPQERALFYELLLAADDFGIVELSAGRLRASCPSTDADPAKTARMLAHFLEIDLIRTYTVGGKQFAWIPRNGFFVRSKKPRYPLPQHEDGGPAFNELRYLARKCYANEVGRIADALHPHPTSTSTNTSTKDLSVVNSLQLTPSESPHVRRRSPVGSRMSGDWTPSEKDVLFCRQHGLSVETITETFRDFWLGKSGKDATKVDWSATFRNWIRREATR